MSLHDWKVSGATPFVGLANYAEMLQDERFQWAILRTVEFTAATDTPAAIEAATWYQKIMRECPPPGVIGFNWNECQTTFMQGRAAMWWDGIGFSAPLIDPTRSRVVGKVGFAPDPAGKVANCATFIDGIGIPATAKNKKQAWLFLQWVTGKKMLGEMLRTVPRHPRHRDHQPDFGCGSGDRAEEGDGRIPAGAGQVERDVREGTEEGEAE